MSLNQLIDPDFPQPQEPLLHLPARAAAPAGTTTGFPPRPPTHALPRVPRAQELGSGELRMQGRAGVRVLRGLKHNAKGLTTLIFIPENSRDSLREGEQRRKGWLGEGWGEVEG